MKVDTHKVSGSVSSQAGPSAETVRRKPVAAQKVLAYLGSGSGAGNDRSGFSMCFSNAACALKLDEIPCAAMGAQLARSAAVSS